MTYDPADPEPLRAPAATASGRRSARAGSARRVYELPPGQALCPYHYESEEEWLLVLQGEVTVRHPEGEDVLGPGDVTAFPAGPAGAHKTTNHGTETVRMLMFANSDPIGYCRLPGLGQDLVLDQLLATERDDVRVRRGRGVELLRRRALTFDRCRTTDTMVIELWKKELRWPARHRSSPP